MNTFESSDIDLLHIDVMDGSFAPNFALGTGFIKQLKKNTKIPLDIHLMTENPERVLDLFEIGAGGLRKHTLRNNKVLRKSVESR